VRPVASLVLQRLVQNVLREPNNPTHWNLLLNFAPACFSRPGRGGKSRNLTTLVKRQIEAFDSRTFTPHSCPLNGHSSNRGLPRVRKGVSDDEAVARRASMKLEEGP
jgi:hypothetical protein